MTAFNALTAYLNEPRMLLEKFLVPTVCAVFLGACASDSAPSQSGFNRGQVIFASECSACHASAGDGAGPASLGLGMALPDISELTYRNDGVFPREFVQRFVLGWIEKEDPDAAMPEFGKVGLEHAAKDGSPAGEVSSDDMIALLNYLETIQK